MENNWQPAILLPEENMCPFHRALWQQAGAAAHAQRTREVGKRVFVRPSNKMVPPHLRNEKCAVIEYVDELPADAVYGAFACEFSTD